MAKEILTDKAIKSIADQSDKDLQLAIAEKLGYKWYEFIHPDKGPMGERLLLKPSLVGRSLLWREADMVLPYDKIDSVSNVPNYPGDIAAAVELEEEICKTVAGRRKYIDALQDVLGSGYKGVLDLHDVLYNLIHATARQRSEAWLIAGRNDTEEQIKQQQRKQVKKYLDVCTEIKVAEDKRGKEVLELVCKKVCKRCDKEVLGGWEEGVWVHIFRNGVADCDANNIRQAYKERYEMV